MALSANEAEKAVQAGAAALRDGNGESARAWFGQVIEGGYGTAPLWLAQAQACRMAGDDPAEQAALDQVLAAEPRNIHALIMKGDNFARAGDMRAAVSFYRIALTTAPLAGDLPPQTLAALERAEAAALEANRRFENHLDQSLQAKGFDREALSGRIVESLDILCENKPVFLQQPTSYYFPGLPQVSFYDAGDFAWAAAVEAAAPAIRGELLAILEEEGAFTPYVEAEANRPHTLNEMLGDPSWGAYHLMKGGEPVEGHAERCPITLEALRDVPMPRIKGRSPMVLFSLLRPGAHIQPHNGMLNTRLICHLPLIVPPGCRFRVGNAVREWEEGKLLVFDDSIEHEAWNDGDSLRVILLFEIWRPEIVEQERGALTAIFEAITDYGVEGFAEE